MKKLIILLSLFQLTIIQAFPQNIPWISYPSANVTDYGVFHFRRAFNLDQVPEKLIVHISADNRYQMFVNGQRICYGPAKGDFQTYKYDLIDIAPWLKAGKNQLATLVYNAGKDKPMAFWSAQTAFLFEAEDTQFAYLNSDRKWKVYKNPAYTPVSYYEMLFKERWFYGYYACGPGDDVVAAKYPWGWESVDYDDSKWQNAESLSFDGSPPWNLVPRNIAFMDTHEEHPKYIRIANGAKGSEGFIQGTSVIKIPANTKATILFDYEIFTMGYPELEIDKGVGSSIKIKYAEALYEGVNLKAHRDSVNNKTMFGVWDVFHPDGQKRIFRPLWKRAFRYIQLEIETKEEALEIHDLHSEYSGYPYPDMATFTSDDASINDIFEMGLRTLRMCSGETYYDTPYYEQLSYGGDNRPIAAISTYNSTDDRLLREVLRLYPQSVNKETGLFKSAYPSRFDFDMGSWSLAWIQSLYDYYLIRGDSVFVKQFVSDIEGVLGFYDRHIDEEKGILGGIKCQNFMDWSITKGSIPRANEEGVILNSTMLTLYYLHTLDCVEKLFNYIGEGEKAIKWAQKADRMRQDVKNVSYDENWGLFTDNPGSEIYSQHTNIMAILCDVGSISEQQKLMKRILEHKEFDEYASSYFSFLLFKAMKKVGMEEMFFDHLDFWENFISTGHTTCGETGFASHDRSDCHAWSAHPSYYLLSLVCGIQPADVGFNQVSIAPHLGSLTSINATMPHPKGRIMVEYKVKKRKLSATIHLPEGMSGNFEYNNTKKTLIPGKNEIEIKND